MNQKQFERMLNNCSNLKEVFDLCNSYYETETTKLGVMSKQMVIFGIMKALTILNPKQREQ